MSSPQDCFMHDSHASRSAFVAVPGPHMAVSAQLAPHSEVVAQRHWSSM